MGELSLTETVAGVRSEAGSPVNYTLPFIEVFGLHQNDLGKLIIVVVLGSRADLPD